LLTRYPIALAATVIALAIAGRRLLFLFHLVTAGKPAPDRLAHWGRRAGVEITEVGGQKRLLKWTVPGLAHAFTFWGFTILFLTIIEAFGDLFQPTFHIPLIGTNPFVGLSLIHIWIGWFGTHLVGPDGKIHFWWDMLIVIGFSVAIYFWAVASRLPENRVDEYIKDVYPPEGELLTPEAEVAS